MSRCGDDCERQGKETYTLLVGDAAKSEVPNHPSGVWRIRVMVEDDGWESRRRWRHGCDADVDCT